MLCRNIVGVSVLQVCEVMCWIAPFPIVGLRLESLGRRDKEVYYATIWLTCWS